MFEIKNASPKFFMEVFNILKYYFSCYLPFQGLHNGKFEKISDGAIKNIYEDIHTQIKEDFENYFYKEINDNNDNANQNESKDIKIQCELFFESILSYKNTVYDFLEDKNVINKTNGDFIINFKSNNAFANYDYLNESYKYCHMGIPQFDNWLLLCGSMYTNTEIKYKENNKKLINEIMSNKELYKYCAYTYYYGVKNCIDRHFKYMSLMKESLIYNENKFDEHTCGKYSDYIVKKLF
jgi:hypothetical protein